MISAYTFDASSNTGQSKPHSADVDARIRRDIFNGQGNIIATGDRNGWINQPQKEFEYPLPSEFKFKANSSTTFVAGGRLFSTGDDELTVVNTKTYQPVAGYGDLIFDVNTKDANHNFVTNVKSPSYPTVDDDSDVFDKDVFSVIYKVIFVRDTELDSLLIYPSPEFTALNAMGTVSEIGPANNTMNDRPLSFRGGLTTDAGLFISNSADVFTLNGKNANWLNNNNITISFATRNTSCPYRLEPNDDTDNPALLFFNNKSIIKGKMVKPESNAWTFAVTDLQVIVGEMPPNDTEFFILANFNGKYNYL